MIRKTIIETLSLLFLAFCIAMLYHGLSTSGITIFKKRPAAQPSAAFLIDNGGNVHGG